MCLTLCWVNTQKLEERGVRGHDLLRMRLLSGKDLF